MIWIVQEVWEKTAQNKENKISLKKKKKELNPKAVEQKGKCRVNH